MEEKRGDGKIPTIYIKANSIPEAYYQAIKSVHEEGYTLRTQYDRRDVKTGEYIDPPGKDAKVMIEITDPFAEPRFPPISFCERGKYIAEFLGAKDHLVVPYKKLLEMIKRGEEFFPTLWPYCYHQRLTAYPCSDGSTINQLEIIIDKLSRDLLTRRAVALTGVPEIDLFLKEDQPCLREIQLRAIEDEKGRLILNLHALWRGRAVYTAWGDNLVGITNQQRELAGMLAEKTGREVVVGPYTEANGSLHIYGQDYVQKGMDKFFKNFPTVEDFINKSWTSEKARDLQILPELKELKTETYWNFPPRAISIIEDLIKKFETERLP